MPTPAFQEAFEKVSKLAATFQANEARYLSPDYQEAEARKDFIDKFFIALGWDVNHDQQTNPYEQEVKVEPPVSAAGQRRADYAFHVAPNYRDVRFFVEAKKPHGDIATADNYFQTIRYGWNSETPLAVLTDFEQLHVLDCRYKPDIGTALKRYVARYHYTEYLDRKKFAEIYWLFSREAVADGSLEKRAKELPKPRGKAVQRGLFPGGYQSIDESFLKELDQYRTSLAHTFKNKNPMLDSETLTELAQRTLDRLVFLRFLEDKGIEPQRLVDKFGDKGTAWEDFIAASRRLDGIYNGIVFKQHDILDGGKFRVDDTAFADICESLAHINSPYDFDAIPIHILGSIYERFLGNVIVATDKRAKVEPKPEVRKAGGVYYTPEYIVRYIVENTVGKLIAGKTADQIAEMRFADIACGSGSFLLGVFELLLAYHGHYYNENPSKARKGDCVKHNGQLYLSLRKKREILLNNIYGVDIDAQAVEVCQLSLYLKLLQEETTASTHQYLLEFEHVAQMKKLLPDLSKNIVCGNSLIGTDILEGQHFTRDEERKLNPMNFDDAFPEVMKRGGFDAIVGNPPYLYSAGQNYPEYFACKFELSEYQTDFYVYFVERSLSLARPKAKVSFIVSDSWLKSENISKLRNNLLEKHRLDLLAVFDYPVFAQATLENSVFVVTVSEKPRPTPIVRFSAPDTRSTVNEVDPQDALRRGLIDPRCSPASEKVVAKVERQSARLDLFVRVNRGIHAYRTDGYGQSKFGPGPQTKRDKATSSYHADRRLDETYLPELKGKDVFRYDFIGTGKFLSYGPWLAEPREPEFFFRPKVTLRKILGPKLHGTFVEQPMALDQSLYILISQDEDSSILKFLLGVLLSSLGGWYLRTKHAIYDTLYPWYTKKQLASFPVKEKDERMVAKVEAMLEAKKQLAKAKTDKDKTYYENKCAALDRQIDRLVYELYGLTEEEVQIVERQK